MDPLFHKALATLACIVDRQRGVDNPDTRARASEAFRRLIQAGLRAQEPAAIREALRDQHGLDDALAHDLQRLYEAVAAEQG